MEDWIAEGLNLDAKGRTWINARLALDVLDPSTNVVNARICSWPSYDEKTVSFGANAGTHLLDLLLQTKPRVVVAYNQTAGRFLRSHMAAGSTLEQSREFFTSGASGRGKQRQVATVIEPVESGFGLIVLSQAPTAPNSTDADGVTMRVWAATLARSWIAQARRG